MSHKSPPKNHDLRKYATHMRNEPTEEEKILWYRFLRKYPTQFYRQRIIEDYIVDFYCPSVKLVVELDGMQHYEESHRRYDARRTAVLETYGIIVLRFPNRAVHRQFTEVCRRIDEMVAEQKRMRELERGETVEGD